MDGGLLMSDDGKSGGEAVTPAPTKVTRNRSNRASFAVFADFWLDESSQVSLWVQLYEQLRQAIITRRLPLGTRLPATRLLADELGCSRNTVLGAFEQLIAEGYLEGRIGSGTYIAETLPDDFTRPDMNSTAEANSAACDLELSQRGKLLMVTMPAHREPYKAFAPSLPDVTLFPFETWDRISRLWRTPSLKLLSDTDPCGYWPLRETICNYLRTARMIECKPEHVIITTGAQNGIDMAARLLLDQHDAVWMEDPGYPGLRGALSAADTQVIPVAVDSDGLSIATGLSTGTAPRMIAVAPSHQYPLGVTMSLQRRMELLSFANEANCWIIEDDYDNEFRYAGRPPAALRSLDGGNRVIYVGTFRRFFSLPCALDTSSFHRGSPSGSRSRASASICSRQFCRQPIVDIFIREGFFSAHVRRMRAIYRERQEALVRAAGEYLSDIITVAPVNSGLHLLGHLAPPVARRMDDAEASRRASKRNVIAPPLSGFYADRRDGAALVLGYSAVDKDAIVSATARLAQALTEP